MISETLAIYEILEGIGLRGTDDVHRARHTKPGRDVAFEALPAEFSQEACAAEFEREAGLGVALHPINIATLYEPQESDERIRTRLPALGRSSVCYPKRRIR